MTGVLITFVHEDSSHVMIPSVDSIAYLLLHFTLGRRTFICFPPWNQGKSAVLSCAILYIGASAQLHRFASFMPLRIVESVFLSFYVNYCYYNNRSKLITHGEWKVAITWLEKPWELYRGTVSAKFPGGPEKIQKESLSWIKYVSVVLNSRRRFIQMPKQWNVNVPLTINKRAPHAVGRCDIPAGCC